MLTAAVVLSLTGCGTNTNKAAPDTADKTPDVAQSATAGPGDSPKSRTPTSAVLTVDNSKALAALMKVRDYCGEKVESFASENRGRTIEFDGSIVNMAKHGDYDTRYDILLAPGNKGPESTAGPAFKFEDVNVIDLNLTGADAPSSVGEGDRFRFAAQVLEYNQDQCLLYLEPESTRAR